jgi:hypothetical protein
VQENTPGLGLFLGRSAPDESNTSLPQRCTTDTSSAEVYSQKLNVTSISEEKSTEKMECFWKVTGMA